MCMHAYIRNFIERDFQLVSTRTVQYGVKIEIFGRGVHHAQNYIAVETKTVFVQIALRFC